MKRILRQGFLLLLLGVFIFLSFSTLMPIVKVSDQKPETQFSTARAFKHVEEIAERPHYVGSADHNSVRNYIVDQLQQMGLEVHTQSGYVLNAQRILTCPKNIVTTLEGENPSPGNDLLVLAHYDSDPHSSFGAADDGSGVAAILESIRALKARNITHKNNIIIGITDAEEIGLLGAQLFVEQPELIKNVGLVINFEARGTGGPSNTIIETNHGNAQLVKDFDAAKPHFPMASSLMYEIYKNMPNDTDATVFRKEKDIPSFFFAFIGRHFNYHAATDIPANLDKNSLAHQGSYLMALMPYLGNADLTNLNTAENQVYFNFPFIKLVHYGYDWIFPLLILGWGVFLMLLFCGFHEHKMDKAAVLKGGKALLVSLILCGFLGYFGWKAVLHFYPQYNEILQGFPYNGHLYISAFVLLGLAVLFGVYHFFGLSKNCLGFHVAPLALWLLINTGLAFAFKGASYFIIPVFFYEIALAVKIATKRVSPFLFLLCSIPAIYIYSALVVYVPIALGMQVMYGALLLLALVFGLLLPVFSVFRKLNWLAVMALTGGLFFLVKAHLNADFTKQHPKPNSLIYVLDKDKHKARWKTYDHLLDGWTKRYITKTRGKNEQGQLMASKYGSRFTYTDPAPVKYVPGVNHQLKKDTAVQKGMMRYELKIERKRPMDRIELFSKAIAKFRQVKVNGVLIRDMDRMRSKTRKTGAKDRRRLLTYYPVDNDTLRLQFILPKSMDAEIEVYGASYDLLDNPWLGVPPRDSTMMPKPFVLNDAVVTKQTISL